MPTTAVLNAPGFQNKNQKFHNVPDPVATPFIKWVGGKGRLWPQLSPLLPKDVRTMRHIEPFAGGAALFFAQAPASAWLADVNADLVTTYSAVRDDVEAVIDALECFAKDHSAEHYYSVRERYNTSRRVDRVLRAAMFIYLNKTCFNGLYRVNQKGIFNVPAGRYTNPRIADADTLRRASRLLARAEIKHCDFTELLDTARGGDFIYFDPPYEPVSNTARFTQYAQSGFTELDQARLRDVFRTLDKRGCALMLSNSDAPLIRNLYRDFNISTIAAPRMVNCKPGGRGLVSEVVVRNYV